MTNILAGIEQGMRQEAIYDIDDHIKKSKAHLEQLAGCDDKEFLEKYLIKNYKITRRLDHALTIAKGLHSTIQYYKIIFNRINLDVKLAMSAARHEFREYVLRS
jgi:hypothetical protein